MKYPEKTGSTAEYILSSIELDDLDLKNIALFIDDVPSVNKITHLAHSAKPSEADAMIRRINCIFDTLYFRVKEHIYSLVYSNLHLMDNLRILGMRHFLDAFVSSIAYKVCYNGMTPLDFSVSLEAVQFTLHLINNRFEPSPLHYAEKHANDLDNICDFNDYDYENDLPF